MKTNWMSLIMVVVALVLMAACGGRNTTPLEEQGRNELQNSANSNEVNTANNAGNTTEEPQTEPESEGEGDGGEMAGADFSSLPAEPQSIMINTADERTLEGFYYPAGGANAPVVVLMHWAPGSMADWNQIAPWMQNRDGGGERWFPAMPDGVSFAVVVFNFGGYGSSEYGGSRQSYLDDAVAVLNYAASLEGIDPHRITAIGASIGADASVDSCYLFNDAGEHGTCIGALSLSPGNYLTNEFAYDFAAQMVGLGGYPVWCFAAENDYISPDLCRALTGDSSRAFIYQGGDHGMDLITPEHFPSEPPLDFNSMELVQEFLETAYSMPLNDYDLP